MSTEFQSPDQAAAEKINTQSLPVRLLYLGVMVLSAMLMVRFIRAFFSRFYAAAPIPVTTDYPAGEHALINHEETIIPLTETAAPVPIHARTLSARFLAICALILMTASSYYFRPGGPNNELIWAVLLMLSGAVALGLSLNRTQSKVMKPALGLATQAPLTPQHSRWLPVAAGGILLMMVSEINGMVLNIEVFNTVTSHVQYALFTVGIALVVWGVSGLNTLPNRTHLWAALRSSETLLLVMILVMAFGVRIWQLDTTVRGLIDETHWVDAIRVVEGRSTLKLFSQMSGDSPFSWIFPYWQAQIGALFGHNFIGLRITSAIIGTLTVLALWGLARVLMDRQSALLAALVLATFPPHIHFSRLGLTNIADPACGTFILLFMAYGIRYNQRLAWALAGVALGLSQYFYEAGRLFFPALALGWWLLVNAGALSMQRPTRRVQIPGLLVMVLVAALVAIPFYYTTIAQGKVLFGRMGDSGLGANYWTTLLQDDLTVTEIQQAVERLSKPFLFYVRLYEPGGNYYGGYQGLILNGLVSLFLIGIFHLVWRWRTPASVFILWITAAALANGLLIRDNTVATRYVIILPALAMLIAAGVRYTVPLLVPHNTSQGEVWLHRTLPVGLAVIIGLIQVGYYFGPHLTEFNVQFRAFHPYRDGIDAVLRAVDLPLNTQVYLIGTPKPDTHVPRSFLGYLLYHDPYPLGTLATDEITQQLLRDLPVDRNYAFFVEPDEPELIPLLTARFPDLEEPRYTPYDVPSDEQYVLYFVSIVQD